MGATVYVGLLRAVNVGGSTPVRMEALRDAVERLGFANVRTLLQSGNLLFSGPSGDTGRLESRLEKEIGHELRTSLEFFVRTAEDWTRILRENPFPKEAASDPGRLTVHALKSVPTRAAWDSLEAAIRGRERVQRGRREAYVYYPDGQGRSPLTSGLIERRLGTRATARNWNTVRKLEALGRL